MQAKQMNIGYTLMVLASIVIILAGIKAAAVIVVPFLLSLFLATILSPFYLWLKKLGLGELPSLFIIVLFLVLVISSMISLIGNSVQDFSQNVPHYEVKLRTDLRHMFEIL
ncbi:MAG: AI-2E family transporter, partial [Epsilonproteobacteria bacterium 4484_20]